MCWSHFYDIFFQNRLSMDALNLLNEVTFSTADGHLKSLRIMGFDASEGKDYGVAKLSVYVSDPGQGFNIRFNMIAQFLTLNEVCVYKCGLMNI